MYEKTGILLHVITPVLLTFLSGHRVPPCLSLTVSQSAVTKSYTMSTR